MVHPANLFPATTHRRNIPSYSLKKRSLAVVSSSEPGHQIDITPGQTETLKPGLSVFLLT